MNKLKILVALSIVTFMLVLPAQHGITQDVGLTQHSSTTGGELRRLIDISSPWSGGYIHEDLTVIGRASITDSFTMNNLSPGSDSDYWKKAYDDFDIGFGSTPYQEAIPPAKVGSEAVSGSANKPAAAVAGTSVVTEAENEINIRSGFRWLDLF
jgi:hypothetical protein